MNLQLNKEQKTIKSVHEINLDVARLFQSEPVFSNVSIRGEVGTCNLWGRTSEKTLCYFNLKENFEGKDYVLSCYVNLKGTNLPQGGIKTGMKVVARGSLVANQSKGTYQFKAYEVVLENEIGSSQKALEDLKKELEEMGMFDASYKKPLPKMPKVLGVITSDTGAAIGDIVTVAKKKNPYIQIVVYPSMVSSNRAVEGMVEGIKALEKYPVDVMIIGRGGGSDEELWVYNNREIAQAVFDCSVPTISAVGHTKNKTILDLVVDRFAVTPTEASEMAISDIRSDMDKLDVIQTRLNVQMRSKIKLSLIRYRAMEEKLRGTNPKNRVIGARNTAQRLETSLKSAMERILVDRKHSLGLYIEKFKGLSPLEKLSQGYSYTSKDGKTVNSIKNVMPSDDIEVFVKDGVIEAKVQKTRDMKWEDE